MNLSELINETYPFRHIKPEIPDVLPPKSIRQSEMEPFMIPPERGNILGPQRKVVDAIEKLIEVLETLQKYHEYATPENVSQIRSLIQRIRHLGFV